MMGNNSLKKMKETMEIPEEIICVDCGERCRLASYPPEEGWEAGMVAFYRCLDCLDRWDIVLEE
tara:strand:+ start:253 stop:444 length:192 start_codon:yes stop_codon:yes gene_type:complete